MASQRPRGLHSHPSHSSPPAAAPDPRPVRRNLFQAQLSRRPPISRSGDPVRTAPTLSRSTSASASVTSGASTLVLGNGGFDLSGGGGGGIVVRGEDEFEVGDPVGMLLEGRGEEGVEEEEEEGGGGVEKERQRVADAVKHHLRDRNRAPSEPAELLEAVRGVLRGKVAQLGEDEWMYEAESEVGLR
ncbi:hypothetical protein VE03_03190 [Pseudogymnoascus sp. 23342-1-I1]|nr:hypothetical protein VE03_03190 [Pseudogymnoascus sp. 23342-1-I1]